MLYPMNDFELKKFLKNIKANLEKLQRFDSTKFNWDSDLQYSAVLAPFMYHESELKLIFTKRSIYLERHKGQVSFPGGFVEKDDKDPVDTALRETFEEIGLKEHQVQVLGIMPPYNSSTGFIIFPVIGFLKDMNGLLKNGAEVEKVFCIPYNWLSDPENSNLMDFKTQDGNVSKVWFYKEFEGELLWGITAKIVRDFIDLIKN